MVADDDDREEALRQRAIADACLGKDAAPAGRLTLYRRLVRGNLATVARRLLPRTAAALDATPTPFDAWVARFLEEAAPRTPYLRDVPAELVAWAEPHWAGAAAVPAYVRDLARYELDRFAVESLPKEASPPLAEIALERSLVFASPSRLGRYAHAVDQPNATTERPTSLFLHRDDDNEIHTTALDEGAAALVRVALEGVSLGEALERLDATTEAARLDAARWLAELGDAGALLGGHG